MSKLQISKKNWYKTCHNAGTGHDELYRNSTHHYHLLPEIIFYSLTKMT